MLGGHSDFTTGGHEHIQESLHAAPEFRVLAFDSLPTARGKDAQQFGRRIVRVEPNRPPHLNRQPRPQALQRDGTVLVLRATLGRLRDDSGWHVAQSHSAIGLVAMLPARPRAAKPLEFALCEQRLVVQSEVVRAHDRIMKRGMCGASGP